MFTSISANYLPKAKILAVSLKKHNPQARFIICLVERDIGPEAQQALDAFEAADGIVLPRDLAIPDFETFFFKFSLVEACCAVKPYAFQELLRRFPDEDKFVFLDPDVFVTGRLTELEQRLEAHDIVLTPHQCDPEPGTAYQAIIDNEVASLKYGVFNLGFLGIRRSSESARLLAWWGSRVRDFGFNDIPAGLFTDQRWMDLAPCFFDVDVFKHRGHNVASWNIGHRPLTYGADGEVLAAGQPLRFIHFSGFDSGANEIMLRIYAGNDSPIWALRREYLQMQADFGQQRWGSLAWTFDSYLDGQAITRPQRQAFSQNREFQAYFKTPFDPKPAASYRRFFERTGGIATMPMRATQATQQVREVARREGMLGAVVAIRRRVFSQGRAFVRRDAPKP